MKLTWLGHSGFRIETGSSVLLIDPFLTGNGIFDSSSMSRGDASSGVTHIALTHGHDDHVGDTVEICNKTGATVIAVYELAMHLGGLGVKNIEPGNPGGTIDCGDFDVSFTKAFHSSSTMIDGQNVYLGNPCGVVVRPKAGPTIYHMGDTEIFGDMALVNEIFAPTVGLVPIGRQSRGSTSPWTAGEGPRWQSPEHRARALQITTAACPNGIRSHSWGYASGGAGPRAI